MISALLWLLSVGFLLAQATGLYKVNTLIQFTGWSGVDLAPKGQDHP
jgi:hypothetical protein